MPLIDNVKVCDPHTDTRRTFTDNLVNVAIPTDAADDWAELTRAHQGTLIQVPKHRVVVATLTRRYFPRAAQSSLRAPCHGAQSRTDVHDSREKKDEGILHVGFCWPHIGHVVSDSSQFASECDRQRRQCLDGCGG